MGVTVIGMLGLSGMAVAWTLGFFDKEAKAAAKPIDRTGQLAFPAIVRPMNAYDALTKNDFINPQTQQLNVIWLPEATAQVASRNMADLIGRVLRRDKQAGMVLSEADFLEKGTRPGLVAGIPAGKFAMSIPASGIAGLEQLRGGDHFDLLVSLPMRDGEDQLTNSEPAALFGGIKPPSLRVGQLSRRHGVKHLVTDGMLVTLFSGSKRSTNGPTGLTVTPSSSKSKSTATPAAVFAELAVNPDEIGPLTEAISLGTKMTCVLRSGLPGGDVGDAMSTEGMVPVITTASPVSAFSALTDENLMDESTGQLHLYYFAPDKISKEWISDPAKLYGRVVARPLRRGSLVTESDLLPPGTRPGISAGLPAGMAGMSLSKENVQGFEKLAVGDTFSILTKVPGEVTAAAPSTSWATLQGGQLSDEDARIAAMVRTGIREVVRDAVYLSESAGDTVIIGIPELEVAKLAQLIRDEVEVFAVARSSQQELDSATRSPLFPGSAWEHTALEALPPAPGLAGGACGAVRSQAGAWELVNFPSPSLPAPLPEAGRGEPETRLVTQNQPGNPFENAQRQGGKIPVPILVQEIPAYEELTIDDFIDPTTGNVQTLYFDSANVDQDWELDIRKLIDRIAVRPLRAGRPVRTIDLAPAGSIAGPSLGLEPGMRGVTVNATQIVGLDSLSVGTVFDLVSARGIEVSSLADKVSQSIASSDAVKEATKLPGGRVAASRTVATQVRLLTNSGTVQIIVPKLGGVSEKQTQTQLTADGSTVTETVKSDPVTFEERTVPQFVLAVPDEFVGSVLGVLDTQNPLHVSLRPVNESSIQNADFSRQGESDPAVRAVLQEHVRGTRIEKEVFLTDRPEPLVATLDE
ncbi:SAF domain protein [Neorhodopirellula pilleata]|uniref:SAF domain protein n=2 Tax=Neorhodopirellula pilleata TaxID=2714738 RepID=A0A5C6A294_9BACT|nr:SAF domain protein [Neorhodopirellula pilleata]